jgi:hypothetical protein
VTENTQLTIYARIIRKPYTYTTIIGIPLPPPFPAHAHDIYIYKLIICPNTIARVLSHPPFVAILSPTSDIVIAPHYDNLIRQLPDKETV